jgi:hypothetical protein
MLRGRSWTYRWLYPASSEPPPVSYLPDAWFSSKPEVPEFPPWMPPHWEQSILPVPDLSVIPFSESAWTMVYETWSVASRTSEVQVEARVPFVYPPTETPQFPPWRPPDHPSYFSDDEDVPQLPQPDDWKYIPNRRPWRPIPWLESFYTEEEQPTFPESYENMTRMPLWPKPWIRFPWDGQEDEPRPPLPDLFQPMNLLPPLPPVYMPPETPPYYSDEPGQAELCPPPCLRRPPGTCPPPQERPYSGPSPP